MDLRIRLTKQLVQTALVQLMKEKPITKITVKELCERAKISRPTFYQYYTDIFDLADKTEDAFIELLIQKSEKKPVLSKKEQLASMTNLCNFYLENRDLFLAFCGGNGDSSFSKRIVEASISLAYEIGEKYPLNYAADERRYVMSYLLDGTLSVIYEWLSKEKRESVDKIAELLTRISFGGINARVECQ